MTMEVILMIVMVVLFTMLFHGILSSIQREISGQTADVVEEKPMKEKKPKVVVVTVEVSREITLAEASARLRQERDRKKAMRIEEAERLERRANRPQLINWISDKVARIIE